LEFQLLTRFQTRRPALHDLDAVAELLNDYAYEYVGAPAVTLDELRSQWQIPHFDLSRDAWLVADGQRVVGYLWLDDKQPHTNLRAWGRVHPDYVGLGIGAELVQLAEKRAREAVSQAPADMQVALYNRVNHQDEAARALLQGQGYREIRHFWQMVKPLDFAPPAPSWPQGISARQANIDQDAEIIYQLQAEIFHDHWAVVMPPFQSWLHVMTTHQENFDPSLWFLVCAGSDVIGFALCNPHLLDVPDMGRVMDMGWINLMGIRSQWQRKGIGSALLRHVLGEFYRRGVRQVALGVDADSPYQAARLYEKEGMRRTMQFDMYQKILRPGEVPANQR
jgi:mycothiol synthase